MSYQRNHQRKKSKLLGPASSAPAAPETPPHETARSDLGSAKRWMDGSTPGTWLGPGVLQKIQGLGVSWILFLSIRRNNSLRAQGVFTTGKKKTVLAGKRSGKPGFGGSCFPSVSTHLFLLKPSSYQWNCILSVLGVVRQLDTYHRPEHEHAIPCCWKETFKKNKKKHNLSNKIDLLGYVWWFSRTYQPRCKIFASSSFLPDISVTSRSQRKITLVTYLGGNRKVGDCLMRSQLASEYNDKTICGTKGEAEATNVLPARNEPSPKNVFIKAFLSCNMWDPNIPRFQSML